MSISIDITLINNQLLNKKKKNEDCDDYNNDDDDNESKIVPYDFFSINEININSIINTIPYWSNYYDIILDYDFIDISKIGEKIIENVDLNDNNIKYLICHYSNKKYVDFQDFLFNIPDIKQFIFNILNSYPNLLKGLIKLNDKNICFFELNTHNIVFSNNTRPFLQNFKNSLLISELSESYIKNIIKNINNYTYKPLEIHVLFYLIINNEETLSLSFIEKICSNYVKNMNVLSLFSQSYTDSYEKACIDFLKKYINKPKSTIISDILQYYQYWDNYSLSVIYLHIIGNISRFFSLKGTFINKFSLLLSKNIHPNPLKRETLNQTFDNYDKLIEYFTDWSFINEISNEKLKDFYTYLQN